MGRTLFAESVALFLLAGCRAPTQVTVELTTDIPCSDGPKTTLQVGHPGQDVEGRPPTVGTTACETGRIGSLVLVPSGAKNDEFAVKAVLAHGDRTPDRCASAEQEGKTLPGCIVARRAMRFVPHEELSLPIALLAECDGVVCPINTTCVRGRCAPADDPRPCEGAACLDASVPPPNDAAKDAPPNDEAKDAPPNDDAGDGPALDVSQEDGAPSCQAGPSPTMYHFVDPVAGTDDPAHGRNLGACAFRSLTYALAHATGPIVLASAIYSAESGEQFPIVLRGDHKLACSFDQSARATIRGKGRYAPLSTEATIVLEGNLNEIFDCIVDGGGGSGACIDVVASGSQAAANIVRYVDLGNCGDAGLRIESGVAGVWLFNSNIHHSRIGAEWLGGQDRCLLNQSTFSMNGTDIVCRDSGAKIYGAFNGGEGGAKPTCLMCQSCPF